MVCIGVTVRVQVVLYIAYCITRRRAVATPFIRLHCPTTVLPHSHCPAPRSSIPHAHSRTAPSYDYSMKPLPAQPHKAPLCSTRTLPHAPVAPRSELPTWAARRWAPSARACRAPSPAARRRAGRRSGTSCTARRWAGSRCKRGRGRTRSAPRAAPPRR
jgi:hypothetical protein